MPPSVFMTLCIILFFALTSCTDRPDQNPPAKPDSTKIKPRPAMTITQVLAKYTDEWMSIPGVIGTGEGKSDGKPSIVVFVEQRSDTIEKKIPKTVDGHPVVIEVTGTIEALPEN